MKSKKKVIHNGNSKNKKYSRKKTTITKKESNKNCKNSKNIILVDKNKNELIKLTAGGEDKLTQYPFDFTKNNIETQKDLECGKHALNNFFGVIPPVFSGNKTTEHGKYGGQLLADETDLRSKKKIGFDKDIIDMEVVKKKKDDGTTDRSLDDICDEIINNDAFKALLRQVQHRVSNSYLPPQDDDIGYINLHLVCEIVTKLIGIDAGICRNDGYYDMTILVFAMGLIGYKLDNIADEDLQNYDTKIKNNLYDPKKKK